MWKITKKPTYTENGVMTRTCSACHATETRTMPRQDDHSTGKDRWEKKWKDFEIVGELIMP